jgi:hypothetical protein
MLPVLTLPPEMRALLRGFRPCFTKPSWRTFCALATGLVVQGGRRTVCGLLVAAGLSQQWSHDRVHAFFSRARWSAVEVGLVLARLIVVVLLAPGADLVVAVDDTLIKRSGRAVWGRFWQHDGARQAPPGMGQCSYGVTFVTAGIVVRLPFLDRPVCLPVLAVPWLPAPPCPDATRERDHQGRRGARGGWDRMSDTARTAVEVQRARRNWRRAVADRSQRRAEERAVRCPSRAVRDRTTRAERRVARAKTALGAALAAHGSACARVHASVWGRLDPATPVHPTKTELGIALAALLAEAFPDRMVHVVADAAYHSPALRVLPRNVTWTIRLGTRVVLHDLPKPPLPGHCGAPRLFGPRLGTPAQLAANAHFRPRPARHAGRVGTGQAAAVTGLWARCTGSEPMRWILIRNPGTRIGCDVALATTDLAASVEELITRYGMRWSIEVAFRDARQHLGLGQPQNRTRLAVTRTVPFQLVVLSLVIVWYATREYASTDVAARRALAPWYPAKTSPSFHDMVAHLRRDTIRSSLLEAAADPPRLRALLTDDRLWLALAA